MVDKLVIKCLIIASLLHLYFLHLIIQHIKFYEECHQIFHFILIQIFLPNLQYFLYYFPNLILILLYIQNFKYHFIVKI